MIERLFRSLKFIIGFFWLDKPYFLIGFLSLILVLVWFKDGNIMGTGESGLPFYDFSIQYGIQGTAWFKQALGGPTNVVFASSPSYFVLSWLQKLGVPNVLMQAIFFWICLVVSGISIFKLTQEFFPELERRSLLLAVLFYWFNPISLVNVWNRFLNNYFIFFAFLPLSLFLFVRGLKTRRYYYVLLFVIFSALFSYAHSSMAFNVLLWFAITFTALFFCLVAKNYREIVFILKYSLIFLVLWVITNLWWILQVFNYIFSRSFDAVTNIFFTDAGNYLTFSELSYRLGRLSEVLSFTHQSFYAYSYLPWFQVYDFPIVRLLNYLMAFVIFLAIFSSRKRLGVLFFSSFMVIALFLIKGNSNPFGEILSWLFPKFSILQLFRNPFEKFGFLLVLAVTPIFAFALSKIPKKGLYNLIYWLAFGIVLIVWGFPYWSGLVFTSSFKPTDNPDTKFEVIVPDDYKKAAQWLSSQNGDFRMVVFPLFREGITYEWKKGFSGIELTNQLLPVPSISFDTTIPFYHDIAVNIEADFFENENFYPLMNVINAKYILLRKDVDWKERGMRDPEVVLKALKAKEEKGELKKVADFGRLSFWENMHYLPNEISVAGSQRVISAQPRSDDLINKGEMTILVSEATSHKINSKTADKIYPDDRIITKEFNNNKFAPQNVFPHISVYPEKSYYPLILIKEKIQETVLVDEKKRIEFKLMLLGKRIREVLYEGDRGKDDLVFSTLDRYKNLLAEYQKLYGNYITKNSSVKEDIQLAQAEIFHKHFLYFNELEALYSGKKDALDRINFYSRYLADMLTYTHIYPRNLIVTNQFPLDWRLTYKFIVPDEGIYELLIKNQKLLSNFDISTDREMAVQVNDQVNFIKPTWTKEGNLMLGTYKLQSGSNEIGFNVFTTHNLVNANEDINLEVEHGKVTKIIPINSIIAGRKYDISFDYLIKKGVGPIVKINTDNSPIKDNEIKPLFLYEINPNYYDFDKSHYGASSGNLFGSTQADLALVLKAWNSCKSIFLVEEGVCENMKAKVIYDRTSRVSITNVSVREEFNEQLYLEKKEVNPTNPVIPKVSYRKIDPTKYQINISGAKGEYYLTLSQLFDAGWVLKTEDGKQIGKGPFIVNIFENGWLIDEEGDYKMVLEYEPQKILLISERISIAVIFGAILTLIGGNLVKKFRR